MHVNQWAVSLLYELGHYDRNIAQIDIFAPFRAFKRFLSVFLQERSWKTFSKEIMDSFVEHKLQEWNLSSLKDIFEGKGVMLQFMVFQILSSQFLAFIALWFYWNGW
jgi:hypothetical protein